jgi:hypothetical protein
MFENKRLVNVIFKGSKGDKEYLFACYDDIEVGDKVVVSTAFGLGIGTVKSFTTEVPNYLDEDKLREVVCKIDLTNFMARREARAREQVN